MSMANDWVRECAERWFEHGKAHCWEHGSWRDDIEAAIREALKKAAVAVKAVSPDSVVVELCVDAIRALGAKQ